ncbi:hypothetical protein [Actinomadura formosensis]|uniref:hypothetical protein n=1 Tax=Actinomadura formosensis TaxID=60706 RepID=UPI000831A2DD|nr:hypothetical protein [Actinomadura formosensis]
MDDDEREPDTPGTEDEHDSSRTATAEFQVPKVNLTRPDIAVRRPRPAAERPTTASGTWYVEFPSQDGQAGTPQAPAEEDPDGSVAPDDEPAPPPQDEPAEEEAARDEPVQDEAAADTAPEDDAPEDEEAAAARPEARQDRPDEDISDTPAEPPQPAPTQGRHRRELPAEDPSARDERPQAGTSDTRTDSAQPASPRGEPERAAHARGTAREERPQGGVPPAGAQEQDRDGVSETRTDHPQTHDGPGRRPPHGGPWHAAPPPHAARPHGGPAENRPVNDAGAPQYGAWQGAPPQDAAPARLDDPAGPTRVERLPVPLPQRPGEQPGARSSEQWGMPWDGAVQPAQPQHPQQPVQPVQAAPQERAKRGRRWLIVLVAMLVLVAGVVTGQLVRPVPQPTIRLALASSHAFPGQAPALPWPTAGQSVVYVEGLGTMGAAGGSAPIPTASVAKVMTAYVYLRAHPLRPGAAGPVLTVSPQAAAQIPMRKKRGESLLGVTANQQLTQRKALEALLVISANDVAHELARWDSGNEQAFVAKMNAAAAELGMTSTRYTDPSGYDSGTVSTAQDQVKLLRAAMAIPAFTEIVNNRAYVPDNGGAPRAGGNFLLGQYGIVGGKTGYTDAAGGNFVFAARRSVGGARTLIVGAVMGQRSPSAAGAVDAAGRLVTAAAGALTAVTLAPKGAAVGRVDDGLGGTTPLRAAAPVTVVGWSGLTVPVGATGRPPHRGDGGERVGAVRAGAATIPLELGRTLDEPSYLKRLIRLA